jgi:hypothetical protein
MFYGVAAGGSEKLKALFRTGVETRFMGSDLASARGARL